MYNRILKNHQVVNVGIPFKIKSPVDYQTVNNKNLNKDQVSIDLSMEEEEILKKARVEAEQIIEEARFKALSIIEKAKQECDELKKATIEQALKKGYQEGYDKAMKEYSELIEEAKKIKEQARKDYSKAMASIEKDAVQLVLNIVRKVIGYELSQNPESILSLIREAIEKCSASEVFLLTVSEKDYNYILKNSDKLQAIIKDSDQLEIKMDPTLGPGSCILETTHGCIDASVETKLANLEEAFKEQMEHRIPVEMK